MDFWKRPKFWIGFIVIAWLAYVLFSNFQLAPVEIRILPFAATLQFKVSAIIIGSVILGVIGTLVIQWLWRRRSSKNASVSVTEPVTSARTVA